MTDAEKIEAYVAVVLEEHRTEGADYLCCTICDVEHPCPTRRLALALSGNFSYVTEDADDPCAYGCGCSHNEKHLHGKHSVCAPHGRCRSCKARAVLAGIAAQLSGGAE